MCDQQICLETDGQFTIEWLIDDPLTQLVMRSDGISAHEFADVLYRAQDQIVRREWLAA